MAQAAVHISKCTRKALPMRYTPSLANPSPPLAEHRVESALISAHAGYLPSMSPQIEPSPDRVLLSLTTLHIAAQIFPQPCTKLSEITAIKTFRLTKQQTQDNHASPLIPC